MEITAASTGVLGAKSGTTTASKLNSDFETFLKMLTTQMKNQDPLNPVDSTEYATQLAMFTSVEQQVLTNDRLASIQDTLVGNELVQVSGWVGKQARIEGPFKLGDTPQQFEFTPSANSDQRFLVIQDALGQVIASKPIALGDTQAEWDGSAGTVGASYSASVQILDADGNTISETPAAYYAELTEMRLSNGSVSAILTNGLTIPLSSILALRKSEQG